MKKITFARLLVAGLAVVGSQMAAAQGTSSQSTSADRTADAMTDQQLALLRRDIRSIKKQLIAANLTLMDSESTKFWQVYEQYSVETGKIHDTRAEIIKQYSDECGTQTDDQAEALIRMYREDYARAGYLVLPASELKDRFVAWQSLLPALGLFVVALVPALRGVSGVVYFAGALALGSVFVHCSARFALQRSVSRARQLLLASILYLPVLFALLALDKKSF